MLKLVDIKKDYVMSDEIVNALKGVSINFRRCEFVAILGPSGCGKTTLLNIVGGLDRYTSGDLLIEGKSTKHYKDNDWDTYRNHSIGFVFQSYNLIQHISVLANVELALTISGVSKQERKQRALDVLDKVGLKGKEKKKPNQLSGGQMQRVAIARALINNPEIVLADEPTGALDSETSIQIMELLKEVSKDRLVIMVTHNPDLAYKYANRIVKMSDGLLIDDSNPYDGETLQELNNAKALKQINKGSKKLTSMSFLTALGLSFNNLMTKKARTFLISFAGSIGIIGITLILSLSYGFNNYIKEIQTNSMSTYPLIINKESFASPTSLIFGGLSGNTDNLEKYPDSNIVSEDSNMTDILSELIKKQHNDTQSFKTYIESEDNKKAFEAVSNDIQYVYNTKLNIFATKDYDGTPLSEPRRLAPVNDAHHDSYMYQANTYRSYNGEPLDPIREAIYQAGYDMVVGQLASMMSLGGGNPFGTLMNNQPLLEEQYDLLEGHFPTNINEVVIKVDQYNRISDMFLYGVGLKDISYMISQFIYENLNNPSGDIDIGSIPEFPKPAEDPKYQATFEDLMNLSFTLMLDTQTYEKISDDSSLNYHYENKYPNVDYDKDYLTGVLNNSFKLNVVGIIRPKKGVSMDSFTGCIGYHPDLYKYVAEQTSNPSDLMYLDNTVVKDQIANQDINVLTGEPFDLNNGENISTNLSNFGYINYSSPDQILIYPKSFESKNEIMKLVDEYNNKVSEKKRITVTDNVGVMLDSVQIIVDSISYVLIAFVSISLLVSSIMIGIITYVSVLERTKEIGVLRSIGARKKDVSRVFNAETLIIGLAAGLLGIGIASLLNIPIMIIINHLTEIGILVVIPWVGAIALPLISVILTLVAGLIPSSIAAKKDPVIALRSE